MEFAEVLSDISGKLALAAACVQKSMRAAMREAVREEELTPNEIEVLLFLRHEKGNTAGEIARSLGISRSLVSKSVDLLLKRGCIQAEQDARDRRIVRLALLPKAEQTVEKLDRVRVECVRRMCRGITSEEGAAFESIVRKIMENLEMEGEGPA